MSGICKAKARRKSANKTKYEVVQPKRTEQNKLRRERHLKKGREQAKPEPAPKASPAPREESPQMREGRHAAHQNMLRAHQAAKAPAREERRRRVKPIPITLI